MKLNNESIVRSNELIEACAQLRSDGANPGAHPMKLNNESIVRDNKSIVRLLRCGRRGQTIVLMTISLVVFLGIAGFAIDIGRLYYAYQELMGATQAAALAGGTVLATDTSNNAAADAKAAATNYSAVKGSLNARSNLTNVTMVSGYPQLECLTTTGISCTTSPADANAIVVSEQANFPTTFLSVVGVKSLGLRTTATASASGGVNAAYNVAIVLDTTASMNDTDSDSQCNNTRLSCALTGIRTLLGTLSPCAAGASCGTVTNGNVANPVDKVSLTAFPGMASSSDASDDYQCPNAINPPIVPYNSSPAYQIIPLSSDYRTSDTASLNTSSDMVIAAGGGCSSGVAAPGGEGTFYAGVIDAAQAQLEASSAPNTKNIMIVLSDGDANATSSQMGGKATTYPATQECHQAITEAQKATAAGTTIYSVAYGAESSGCSTDTNPTITPCQTMQQIASSPSTFYSDYTAKGGTNSCISAATPTSNLNAIFKAIGQSLTVARLIPNNTK
jgi:Flp pilus assembly protein TadG